MSKRNPYAKALSSSMFKPKVVKAVKGKGSYSRKSRSGSDHRTR
jgi:stalled ribosome alternative rescue factor ArfA